MRCARPFPTVWPWSCTATARRGKGRWNRIRWRWQMLPASPIVATNEVYSPMRACMRRMMRCCIAEGRLLQDADRRRVTPEHWLKPPAAMRAALADLPDACDNTLAIARLCAVMAETRKPELPTSPKVLPGRTEAETLAELAASGLEARIAALPEAEKLATASVLPMSSG